MLLLYRDDLIVEVVKISVAVLCTVCKTETAPCVNLRSVLLFCRGRFRWSFQNNTLVETRTENVNALVGFTSVDRESEALSGII